MIKKTIGNEALAYVFEEQNFNTKSVKTQQMVEMYRLDDISMPKIGDVIPAEFMGRFGNQYVFNVNGIKDSIRIDARQNETKYLDNTEIGEIVDIQITKIDHNNFSINGSVSSIFESKIRSKMEMFNEPIMAVVKELTPAGYKMELHISGITLVGFMPNTLAGINKLHNPESIVGEKFNVMYESYSPNEGTYIVSRRKYLQSLIPNAMNDLYYNHMYTGVVTGTTAFGIFVEFNECLTGMIHKDNVTPEWADRITEIKPGFKIDFYIKEVIKNKLILTQIQRETLWDNIKEGDIIDGIVKDTKTFGTLVNLDNETIGLVFNNDIDKLQNRPKPGDKIKVKVTAVERYNRKIYLTIA